MNICINQEHFKVVGLFCLGVVYVLGLLSMLASFIYWIERFNGLRRIGRYDTVLFMWQAPLVLLAGLVLLVRYLFTC